MHRNVFRIIQSKLSPLDHSEFSRPIEYLINRVSTFPAFKIDKFEDFENAPTLLAGDVNCKFYYLYLYILYLLLLRRDVAGMLFRGRRYKKIKSQNNS